MAPPQTAAEKEAGKALARIQMEGNLSMIHGLTSMCHSKCVGTKYVDGELTVGENACLDRCVSKYFEMQALLQQMMMAGQQPR